MDRTFGKPFTSPVPPLLLVAAAYVLGAGLLFVKGSISCAGVNTHTAGGLALCLGVFALTGIVAAIARHRLIWLIPLLLWTVANLLSISGVSTSLVTLPDGNGGTVCGIV